MIIRVDLLAVVFAGIALAAGPGPENLLVVGSGSPEAAVDSARHRLYVSSRDGLRINVISLSDSALIESIPLRLPSVAVSLSPDGRFLVAAHSVPLQGEPPRLTVIDLDQGAQSFAIAAPSAPLSIAFGAAPRALVTAVDGLYLLDPQARTLEKLRSSPESSSESAMQIVRASARPLADGSAIVVTADALIGSDPLSETETTPLLFRYSPGEPGFTTVRLPESTSPAPQALTLDRSSKPASAPATDASNRRAVGPIAAVTTVSSRAADAPGGEPRNHQPEPRQINWVYGAQNTPAAVGDSATEGPIATGPRTLSACYARANSAPSGADFTLSILKNGSAVATVSITDGSTTGVLAGSPVPFAAGDEITSTVTSVGTVSAAKGISVSCDW